VDELLGLKRYIDDYGIKFERGRQHLVAYAVDWTGDSLKAVYHAFTRVESFLGENAGLSLSGLRMVRALEQQNEAGYTIPVGILTFAADWTYDMEIQTESVVHELGHAADHNMGRGRWWSATKSVWWRDVGGWYQSGGTWQQDPIYAGTSALIFPPGSPWEDFAGTFKYMVEARYGNGMQGPNYKEPSYERQRALAVYFWPSSR
jgi:hypothetical protein